MSVASRLVGGLAWSVPALGVAGLAVRLTLRDSSPITAPLFYATPPVVLGALFLGAAVRWGLRRHGGKAVTLALAGAVCLAWWHQTAFRAPARFPTASDLRVLFWNTALEGNDWWGVVGPIARRQPHVIALVEPAWYIEPKRTALAWQREFPGYELRLIGPGGGATSMLVLCRGRIEEVARGPLGPGSTFWHGIVTIDQTRFHLIVVDLPSNPLRTRRPALEALRRRIGDLGDEPAVLVGDLNLPADSTQIGPLRAVCTHAFETAGAGYAATWPLPMPVWQIDHVWLKPPAAATRCEAGWAGPSDHRFVLTYLDREALQGGPSGVSSWSGSETGLPLRADR